MLQLVVTQILDLNTKISERGPKLIDSQFNKFLLYSVYRQNQSHHYI